MAILCAHNHTNGRILHKRFTLELLSSAKLVLDFILKLWPRVFLLYFSAIGLKREFNFGIFTCSPVEIANYFFFGQNIQVIRKNLSTDWPK